ncbi:cytidine and dCMP deaminase domain-containing protein 1-like [Montipora capricornis]|uniref:cytidine and dCMP deaminase domain-containing protein 1-like n=1 Tax=Montipora capricornis TaxID=246305 RepID=UPI0035F1160D
MASRSVEDSMASQYGEHSRYSYSDRDPRVTKGNLFMVLALWMEELADDDTYRKVGAVLVRPNDMIYAVDCTRNGVHGVARLLMSHTDVLRDSEVFVSRKPCSFCTKLLVQSKVKRVFYLPIEPEYKDLEDFKDETTRVDNLFKVSAVGQSVFVPKAGKEIIKTSVKKRKRKSSGDTEQIENKIKELWAKYWKDEWMKSENVQKELPWPAFDTNMYSQVYSDFHGIVEWMAGILVESEKDVFKCVPPAKDHLDENQAYKFLTLAMFLAERTDDPIAGVGAVIVNKEDEVVALGWNGFPTKALFGEFPRASAEDDTQQDKKYAYILHAEQNALLFRNTKNIAGGTMFVTKTPCDECTPLLHMQGIKRFVLGSKMQHGKKKGISYQKFYDKVKNSEFICFDMEQIADDSKDGPVNKKGCANIGKERL